MQKNNIQKLCYLVILWLTVSCSSKQTNEIPDELVYGMIVGSDPEMQLLRYDKVVAYLSKKTGIKMRYVKGTDYAAVIEAMKTGKVHIANTGPFSYLLASAKANAEPLVCTQYRDGSPNFSGSILFTSPKSGLNDMEDVKKRASELSIAFADPASTSGYLYPLAHLRSLGLEPEDSFKEVLFAGSHTAGVFSTISGKVDLAATYSIALERLERKNRISSDQYKVLWRSDKIPPGPVYVRKDLPEELKIKLREAFVNIQVEAPEILEIIKEMYNKDLVYVPAADTLYHDLRVMVDSELDNLLVN
ncbi:MAG: phosphate/phosphite/phosphonate ABC transporter substrate-binding protein [Bacteroidota bacterium]